MIKLIVFINLVCYLFYLGDCQKLPDSQLAEQTLITTLFNGYNKNIRPDSQVSVDIAIALQQIISIDEKQQIMTSSSFISQVWYDKRLSWTPSPSNNNIEVVMLQIKSLWIPDTMILNSADASGYLTVSDYSLASVDHTGAVYMILPALTVRTRCDFNAQRFPFDKQICNINLTSWSQGSNRITYTENGSIYFLDTSEYSEHPLWTLNGTDMIVTKAEDRAPFENTYNDIITIQLYLTRKPLFFLMNGIFACFVLNFVTLLSYPIPFGSQIGLCMTSFLTYSVYSLNFSNLFPQQSEYLMTITLYFLLSISWTLISMTWFVIYNHFTTKSEMPKPVYAFCGLLQRVCFCCCSPAKDDAKKDSIVEHGEMNTSRGEESTKAANIQKKKCVCCQKLFGSCFRKNIKVESIDTRQQISIENMESITTNPIETSEKAKAKCDFCNRCESCQADFDKDKAKDKTKKDIEAKCSALNYLVFLFVFLFMLISNVALWITMSK